MSLLPEIKIEEHHVGIRVTHLNGNNGTITNVNTNNYWAVSITYDNGRSYEYSINGLDSNNLRTFLIGDNAKLTVDEDHLHEPKLICPVCGVEHDIMYVEYSDDCEFICGTSCPFRLARFTDEDSAKEAMKNLIKAFKESEDGKNERIRKEDSPERI